MAITPGVTCAPFALQVAGETEVKAQIKLRIKNSHNVPYVIVRSFSLTQKKTNMQFKAIDQTVQTYNRDTQEKEALSYKCVDMDRFVPTLMGASKVRCHSLTGLRAGGATAHTHTHVAGDPGKRHFRAPRRQQLAVG